MLVQADTELGATCWVTSPPGELTSPEHLNFIIHGISHVLSHFLMAPNVSDFPSDLASTSVDGHLKSIASC